jgi:ribonucleoside-diphosphate reductase alpha chain
MGYIPNSFAGRNRLPNRRSTETFEVEFAGLRYRVSVGRFVDGKPAEVFISNHKAGNASDIIARDAGILISFCLQYGAPIEAIARAMSRNSDGSPSGVIGAALDAIMKGSSSC